ncbi:hypothetical protein GCM10027073_32790 [Streptomyces chlorus]
MDVKLVGSALLCDRAGVGGEQRPNVGGGVLVEGEGERASDLPGDPSEEDALLLDLDGVRVGLVAGVADEVEEGVGR